MLVGTCETRPKSRELMKVMGIVLRRIRSAGSVTKSIPSGVVLISTSMGKKAIRVMDAG